MTLLLNLMATPGLGGIQENLVSNWLGPALFIVIAGISIKFILNRQFRELAGFLVIAAVVALLVFNADGLFGEKGVFYSISEFFAGLLGGGK